MAPDQARLMQRHYEENKRLRAALTEIARTPARADVTGETMFTHVRLLAQKALDFTLEQALHPEEKR